MAVRLSDSDVDVSFRFSLLLALCAGCFALDVVRSIFAICFYRYLHARDYFMKNFLAVIVSVFHLINCVFMHLFRLSHSGRVCSGVFD